MEQTENTLNLNQGDFFGGSCTSLGDLDGNNINDIAIGSFRRDQASSVDVGSIFIFFLRGNNNNNNNLQDISSSSSSFFINFIEITNSAGVIGLGTNDQFGASLSLVGDINGDSVQDLCVGARQDNDLNQNSGAIYILFLQRNGAVSSFQKISNLQGGLTELNFELPPTVRFGRSVSNIGDLNQDGFLDIVVGSEFFNGQTGAIFILFLNMNGIVQNITEISPSTEIQLQNELELGDRFGIAVSTSCSFDLNNDQLIDIAVGADADDDGGPNRGAIYLLSLNQQGSISENIPLQKISSLRGVSPDFSFIINGDRFGSSISFYRRFKWRWTCRDISRKSSCKQT